MTEQRTEGTQPDLFDAPARYPEQPGSKVDGTSRESARRIAGHAACVRRAVLNEFIAAYPRGLTSDEAAELVAESILTVRPRVTELKALGMLELTTDRRCNDSGHAAAVLRASNVAMGAT